jgi:hypothetical protein
MAPGIDLRARFEAASPEGSRDRLAAISRATGGPVVEIVDRAYGRTIGYLSESLAPMILIAMNAGAARLSPEQTTSIELPVEYLSGGDRLLLDPRKQPGPSVVQQVFGRGDAVYLKFEDGSTEYMPRGTTVAIWRVAISST